MPAVISSNVFYISPRSLQSVIFRWSDAVLFNEDRSGNVVASYHSLVNLVVTVVS